MLHRPGNLRHFLEFSIVWVFVRLLSTLPRSVAHILGKAIGRLAFVTFGRLRATGLRNLEIAFPERSKAERMVILERLYCNLGHQLTEFCQMSSYTPETARNLIRYEGLDNYLRAQERGKGVLVLTGHLGAWELSSF